MPIPPASQHQPQPSEGALILVVDDDEGNRESLSRRLQRRGYAVETAADGAAALRALEHQPIELVLMDVMMPGMNGLEVLSRLRQTRPPAELPVIMVTARSESDDVVTALQMGANDYVTKPLDFAVVVARVQTQLALRAAVAQVLALERHLVKRNSELERANGELRKAAARTRRELALAAKVQATFLPKESPTFNGVNFAWRYEPSVELAGDALNICTLTHDAIGLYVLDVSGHGVAASLTAVSAARLLSCRPDPDTILVRDGVVASPADVATRLTQSFTWSDETEQFMTLFYAVLEPRAKRLRYVSAGHPPAIRISHDGQVTRMDGSGMPIGVGETFAEDELALSAGDRVYFYSDGVIESADAERTHFGVSGLASSLVAARSSSLDESLNILMQRLSQWRGGQPAVDDVSVLAFELKE